MSAQSNEKCKLWFSNAKLGLFIHWGLYSILGRGEWVLQRDGILPKTYKKLAPRFAPRSFTPESWCLAAVKGGMKYAVLSAKHHDGFSMFASKYDEFNSVNTPANRDFVAEFVAACRKYGLGVGVYFSLGDWRFGIPRLNDSNEKAQEMKRLSYLQLEELMSNYGKIDILWYDGAWRYPANTPSSTEETAEFWDAPKLNAMVRKLQPQILINNRSGTPEDFGTSEGQCIIRAPKDTNLWEACFTLGDDDFSYWGYKHHAIVKRSPAQVFMLLLHAIEHGGNFLLNVGPDSDGVIPPWQQEILSEIGGWMEDHSEAIYGVQKTDIARRFPNWHQGNSCGFFTQKGKYLYFYLYEWPGRDFCIPYMQDKICRITVLKSGQELSWKYDHAGSLMVSGLPATALDKYCTVLKMEQK